MSDAAPSSQLADAPRCPFCGSAEVERVSLFGSQLLTEQCYCHACHTYFEHVKYPEPDDVATPPDSAGQGDTRWE
jgi:hypothetical protein